MGSAIKKSYSRILVALLAWFVACAWGADCIRDVRETSITFDSTNQGARLRHYLCEKPGVGQVSVQFNRLNDAAAGLLLSGRGPAEFRREFGNVRVFPNEISAEFNRLVSQYGELEPKQTAVLGATPPAGEMSETRISDLPDIKVLATTEAPFMPFPDSAALAGLTRFNEIPRRYTSARPNIEGGTGNFLIWRYMDFEDLSNYSSLVQEFNRIILAPRFGSQFRGFRTNNTPTYIRLYRHLAENGLPNDFITILGERDSESSCGDRRTYWEFQFFQRVLVVDFVFIHNRSTSSILVSELLGDVTGGKLLRPPASALPTPAEQRRIVLPQTVRLEPNQRMAVPTRLTWVVPDAFRRTFESEKSTPPSGKPYAWGPEWRVSGVVVNDRMLSLEGNAANFFAVTTSCECGSCPYLYAWVPGYGWRNTGKIIDKALGSDREASETRSFAGLVTRFRLMEQEAELARIDKVSLDLKLSSGHVVTLKPKEKAIKQADGRYLDLAMGDSVDIFFKLPVSLKGQQVKESKLTVTGYYNRYSDILSQRVNRSEGKAVASQVTKLSGIDESLPSLSGSICIRSSR